jgi:hypothetical protein
MTQIGPGTNFTDSIEQHAYYMPNVTGATGVGTCSIPSAGAGHVLEIHWIQLQNVQTSPLDVAVTVSSGSNNPVAAASGMLAEANEVVLGLFSIDGVSCAGNGPWNNSFIPSANGCTDNGGGISTGDANLVVSSTAPVTASYSTETTTSSIMTVLSFKH